jgi:hypothetical protein
LARSLSGHDDRGLRFNLRVGWLSRTPVRPDDAKAKEDRAQLLGDAGLAQMRFLKVF